jgi:DNA-binding MarR family transcriptional regulator
MLRSVGSVATDGVGSAPSAGVGLAPSAGVELALTADVGAAPAGGDAAACHELQVELEHRLLVLADRLRVRLAVAAADLGVTPQQAILLRHLGRPRTMGELAGLLACDPSNVTGLVGRLEARGLVERAVDPADRRVKRLRLTAAGRAHRERLHERFFDDSPVTAPLDRDERRRLLALLRTLTPGLDDGPATPCPAA